ncbi:hypothetical protein HY632_03420, partial [Candidatus Uhrbacteria bacterium]|nr:hypothetical protein [Candidatus Uhrbacteria bacterium]
QGNAPLLKRFTEEIEKKMAHLNYNLTDTRSGGDLEKFFGKVEAGLINLRQLHKSALGDTNLLTGMSTRLNPNEFRSVISDLAKRSPEHKKELEKGLVESFKGQPIIDPSSGKFDARRSAYATISGDLERAVSRNGDGVSPDLGQIEVMIKQANPDLLSKINLDGLSPDLERIIGEKISMASLKGLARSGEMRHFERFVPLAYKNRDDVYRKNAWKDDIVGDVVRSDPALAALPRAP